MQKCLHNLAREAFKGELDPIICQTSSKSVRVNSNDKQISKRYILVQPNPVFFQFFIEEPILINNVLLL
jgi:hypothetical protein